MNFSQLAAKREHSKYKFPAKIRKIFHIPMKNQRFLLIQIQFGRLILSKTFFECVGWFICLCAHSSLVALFYRNQKTIIHYYAYGSMRKHCVAKQPKQSADKANEFLFVHLAISFH